MEGLNTLFVGPHQWGLFLLLVHTPTHLRTGHQVHVCPTLQQELHHPDVSVVAGTVQGCVWTEDEELPLIPGNQAMDNKTSADL